MKRQLTKEEKELTNKNMQKTRDELASMEASLEYNNAVLEKQKYMRDFQTKWADYLYDQKDAEDNRLIELVKVKIDQTKEAIEITEKQLTEGVEVMENSTIK